MQHSFFDKYSDKHSPLHQFNLRLKMGFFLVLLIYFGFVPISWTIFALNICVLLVLFAIAGIPATFIIKRTLVIMPFLVFIVVLIPLFQHQTIAVAAVTFARAISSVLALILFISTTPFPRLLQEFRTIGVPDIIVQVLAFIYRYFFVLIDEVEHMQLAIKTRAPVRKRSLVMTALSHLLGMLIIRSYERSERIYQAMRLRGYDSGEDQ